MRFSFGTTLLFIGIVAGCGSPEKYQKESAATDTTQIEGVVDFRLGREQARWAQELTSSLEDARMLHEAGDTLGALRMIDSLLPIVTTSLDTVSHDDERRKFLLLFITDLFAQAITWEELRQNPTGTASRTRDFEALARHLQEQRDSLADSL